MRKIRQTQDIQAETHHRNSIADNYQSFALGGSKKFLTINLPDVKIIGKQSYKKQPYCIICFCKFTTTFRQHHCRVCANAVCGECSRSMVNKQRACDLCLMRLSNPQQERKKKQMLQTLQTLCAYLLYRKKMKMQQLQEIKFAQNPDTQTLKQQLEKQQKQIEELQKQNQILIKQRQMAQKQMDEIRSRNSKLEESISKIQTDLTGFNF